MVNSNLIATRKVKDLKASLLFRHIRSRLIKYQLNPKSNSYVGLRLTNNFYTYGIKLP